MKTWLFLFILVPFPLFAQEWDQDLFNLENNPPPDYPFSVSSTFLNVSKADFRTEGLSDQTLKYQQWDAALAYTHPLSSCAGLIFGAGWIGTEVDMKQNPDFDQTRFDYINFSFGGYTTSFPDWTWTLTLAAYLDTADLSLIDYALYQGVFWGKYDLCESIELDFGLIIEVGLKKEKVWPIIGFIYFPCKRWRLSVIYPIDISLKYEMSQYITAGGSIRFLRNRHRVGQDELLSQAIFEYRTAGVELDLTIHPFSCLLLTAFAGSTIKGDFKITDRNDHHARHFKFNGSFYAGATAIFSF